MSTIVAASLLRHHSPRSVGTTRRMRTAAAVSGGGRNALGRRAVGGLVAVAAIMLLGCDRGREPTATRRAPVSLSISPPELSLIVAGEGRFTALTTDANGRATNTSVAWSAADATVATVGKADGIVTAISTGVTTITGAIGDLLATATVTVLDSVLNQWAIGATASSEYTSEEWSAAQATGAPNVIGCRDDPRAWATASQNGVDWLELTYAQPVRPSAIRIHEVWAVGSIVTVEVKDVLGAYQTVYTAEPHDPQNCPRVLTIAVSGVTAMVSALRVHVDQRVILDWIEIDAVQLVGHP